MSHRKALTAFEYRRYLGFWFDLGSQSSPHTPEFVDHAL